MSRHEKFISLAEMIVWHQPYAIRTSCWVRGFTDVTLADKDGQPSGAHNDILRAVGPQFRKLLNENGHNHPLIYLGDF